MSAGKQARTAAMETLIEAHATELKLPTVKRRFRGLAEEAARELRVSKARRAYLDRPDQIRRLLDAAEALDALAAPDRRRDGCLRRPLLATLVFGGLRISEALALRWREVDRAGGRLRVEEAPDEAETLEQSRRRRGAKSDAGVRWVPIMPALRSELLARKMAVGSPDPDACVFATPHRPPPLAAQREHAHPPPRARARRPGATARRPRAAPRAPSSAQPQTHLHSLRVAIGDDPAAISRDADHADMGVTFRICTHVMALQDSDREQLRALVAGGSVIESVSAVRGPLNVARDPLDKTGQVLDAFVERPEAVENADGEVGLAVPVGEGDLLRGQEVGAAGERTNSCSCCR